MESTAAAILWLVMWWALLMVQLPLVRLLASRKTGSMAFDPNGFDLQGYGRRLTRAIAALKKNERSEETVNLCVEIERIEEKSDGVMQRAIKALYANEGNEQAALRALALQEFYALQEKVLRTCKASAQMVEEILLHNA